MKQNSFQPGQPLRTDDLERAQRTKEESIRENLLDTYTPGVLEGTQFLAESQAFNIVSAGGLLINVGTGIAIAEVCSDDSSSGDRIVIPSNTTYDSDQVGLTNTLNFQTNTHNTPQSTGNTGILCVDNTTNYAWLGYLKTIDVSLDPGTFSLHKVTLEQLFNKADNGYQIIVTQSSSAPAEKVITYQDGVTVKYAYFNIGKIITSGGSITSVDQTESFRKIARTKEQRVGIVIDASKKPSTYTDLETKFLDDHVNSVGSGTITPSNPHGLDAIIDLGLTEILDFRFHQKEAHSDGIVANSASTTSGLYQVIQNGASISGSTAAIEIKQLMVSDPGESVLVDGIRFSEVFPKASSNAPLINGSSYALFFASDPTDDYRIYLKIVGNQLFADKITVSSSLSTTQFQIGQVHWDGSVLSALVDQRLFTTIATENIRNLAVTTAKIATDAVTKEKIALDVAGDGLDQNVDGSLEVNVDNSTIEINSDTVRVKDAGITTSKININTDLSANSFKITSLATPVAGTDAANKNYVDSSTTAGWTDDGTVVRLITATDQVGLGTASPSAGTKLHVKSGSTDILKAYDTGIIDTPNQSNVRAYLLNGSSNQSIVSGADRLVDFDAEVFDLQNEFDTSTNKFTASKSGYYAITAYLMADNSISTATYKTIIYKNGAEYSTAVTIGAGGSTSGESIPINDVVSLNAGDFIEIYANFSVSLDIRFGSNKTWLTIQKIS